MVNASAQAETRPEGPAMGQAAARGAQSAPWRPYDLLQRGLWLDVPLSCCSWRITSKASWDGDEAKR